MSRKLGLLLLALISGGFFVGVAPFSWRHQVEAQSAPKYTVSNLTSGRCIKVTNASETTDASVIVFYEAPSADAPYRMLVQSQIGVGGDFTFPKHSSDDSTATLYSVTTLNLSDVGSSHTPDDYVDMYLAEELFSNTIDEPTNYSGFESSFDAGTEWHDVDLGDAYGPTLTVEEVTSGCS